MNTSAYLSAFTEEELGRGAELFFAGDLTDYSCKENRSAAGSLYGELFPGKETITVSGKWTEERIKHAGKGHNVSLRIHAKSGMICEASCDCADFTRDLYGCIHTAALYTAYITKQQGEDCLRGTRVETLLRNMVNVEDPFQPGVLKRTDGRLLSLLQGNDEGALPVWKEAAQNVTPLQASFTLYRASRRMMVGLQIGYVGKRLHLVKDLPGFLAVYIREEIYSVGKTDYQLGRRCFDPRSGRLLDFMADQWTAFSKDLLASSPFAGEGGDHRYMILAGPEFDNFMALCDGMSLTVDNPLSGSRLLDVHLDRKGLRILLRKKAYGATLKISDTDYLYGTGNNLYLTDTEGLFRVHVSGTQQAQELLSMLEWTEEEMYIRESEIGLVCRNLLPIFQKYGTVITKGLDLDNYEKEQPEFVFELDLPSEGVLSCVPCAVYKRQDLKCHLYDNETDAVRRNAGAESVVAGMLPEMFQRLDPSTHALISELSEEELFDFMRTTLPRLEELGTVMASDRLHRSRVRSLPGLRVGVSVQSGQLTMSLKGAELTPDEVAQILGAYRKRRRYYRLRSGEFLALEEDNGAWEALSELYHNYGEKDPEQIRIPAFRALYLQETLENRENVSFDATEEYRALLRRMDTTDTASDSVPASLSGILRPYQADGFRWIRMLKRCGFGGILADDMGLGKTLQILSFLLAEKQDGRTGDDLRTLVVCPASLVYNWQRELETYTGELSCVVIAGNQATRQQLIEESGDIDVWITSYDLLKRDIAAYEEIRFANEIIDEAQFVKNQKTQASQSVRVVNSAFRMALTGTPIENYLSELWSIMDYLMPGFLFSYHQFQKDYETPIAAQKDTEALERLRRMVHPFILRRLKKQVLKELPDKLEEVISVRMDAQQQQLYDASAEEIRQMLDRVSTDEFKSDKLQFLAKLTGLRQICCDPSLLYENYTGESAKLEACLELIEQAITGGHKLLLFSQFTSMLDIIGRRLSEAEIEYHRIDGGVSKEKRMQMVDSFANDEVPVFLISLKAGGTGLNLTAADIVIHYDPWWNQAAQDQATDRTHRIGQTQTVTVYELIVQGTVEEHIQKIKDAKSQLVEDVLSGGEISSTVLNKEDMLALL